MTKWEGWIASKGKLPIIQLSAEETAKLILMYVNRYGAKSFLFSDDDFPVGSKQGLARVHDFCSIIVDYKRDGLIPEGVTFSCQARVADFLKRVKKQTIPNWEILEIMKQAGFHSIGMGVETFSDKLLLAPSVNKMGIKVSDCRLIIDAMLTIGLVPQINIILGIPESTVEELVETMEIAVHYITQGCDVAVSRRLLALPGAPIYDAGLYELRSNKWINPVNGQEVLIADYFVPGDPVIAEAMDTMEQEAADELKRITREKGWEGKIVHKRVVGMSALIALSRLIKRNDVAAQFRSVLDDILDEPAKFRKLYPSFSE